MFFVCRVFHLENFCIVAEHNEMLELCVYIAANRHWFMLCARARSRSFCRRSLLAPFYLFLLSFSISQMTANPLLP